MPLSPSSDSSDGDEDMETLNRILAKSGTSPIEIHNDPDSDSESSGSDVQDWFRQIQEKFSMTSGEGEVDPFPVIKPSSSKAPSDSDDEDAMETMAAIHRRFDQYQNDAMKEQSQILLQETDMAITDVPSGQEISDILSKDLKYTHQLPEPGFTEAHQADGSCDLSMKALMYSQFPKSAQNFVDALKKNRSCQKFVRRKLIEIEAKIEENKKLKERVKCLMDFQLSCKRKVGHILCQKKDSRVRLISMRKPRRSKMMKVQPCTKSPALCLGPAENSHVSKYKMVMKMFPVSFSKQPWSNIERENLAKGLKQQYQEMLLLNSMNLESDLDSSMNPDLMSAILSNDLEVTPEKIRSFLPVVNWDRLASMYLTARSGAECESRWLNCEDPLINRSPWTILEDKKLLYIIQERGIYNWIDIAIMLGTQRTPFQCLARYQRSLNPHILNKDWTENEDARLRAAVEIFGDNNWQLVASNLEGRTGPQCSNRWRKTLHPERRKVGRWSVDEDKRLKVAVMLFGAKNWNKIAQFAPGRTQVQCRERWLNCLDPSLKLEAWTKEEDDKLKAAIEEHGYSWSRVATCVPQRTDNQCMRRWKLLFPEEVLLLREARRVKKTVLISNFVDRETERPSIGPNDFSSVVNLPILECGNSRSGKRKSREGARKENRREASCGKKIKKSRAKSRSSSEKHLTEGGSLSSAETAFADSILVPVEPGVSTNTSENGATKRTRKRASREGPQPKIQRTVSRNSQPNKSAVNSMEILDENITRNSISCPTEIAADDTSHDVNSKTAVNGRRIKKARKQQRSHDQPDKSGSAFRQSLEMIPAYIMGNFSEVDPAGLSFVPVGNIGEQGTTSETRQGTSRETLAADGMVISSGENAPVDALLAPSVNPSASMGNKTSSDDLQIRRSRKSTAKDKTFIKETSTKDYKVDVCADEDVPLISWLDSLAFEARSKRSTNKPSRRSGGINQKETYCDDAEFIRTDLMPRDKRKRYSKESIKNGATVCNDKTLSEDKNNKACYWQKRIFNQSPEVNNTVQLINTMVDVSDVGAPISVEAPGIQDIPACAPSSTNETHSITSRDASDDDSLIGFILRHKGKRKQIPRINSCQEKLFP